MYNTKDMPNQRKKDKKFLGAWVPPELKDELKQLAKVLKIPTSTVMEEILTRHVELNSAPSFLKDAPVTDGTEKHFAKLGADAAGQTSAKPISYRSGKSKRGSVSAGGSQPKQGRQGARRKTGGQPIVPQRMCSTMTTHT